MVGAIVGHLVGDYLLQNDFLALNKKSNSVVCAIHCLIWTWCVLLLGIPGKIPYEPWVAEVAGLLFITHYIQDRTNIVLWWMGFIGQEKFATGPCSPWSIIVVDNVWHIVVIWYIWTVFGIK